MTVGSGSFTCDGAAPVSSGGAGAPAHNLILGGQYQYLRLFAESVSIEDGEFVAQVKVQNLSLQPLATLDGDSPDLQGVQVFFVNEPNNGVTVANHSGTGSFIGSEPRKYFEYKGTALGGDGILDRGEESEELEWRFQLNGATEFQFTILVKTTAPDPTATGVHLTSISVGAEHTCGKGDDGRLYCWGSNLWGELAVPRPPDRRTIITPVNAPAGITLSDVFTGAYFTCAHGSDGHLYCWGDNGWGKFGDGTIGGTTDTPVQVSHPLPPGVQLSGYSANTHHICADGSDGAVYCWGINLYGESGVVGEPQVPAPSAIDVSGLGGVTLSNPAVGLFFTCAFGSDGGVYCWGANDTGQLGNEEAGPSTHLPTPVQGLSGVTPVALALGDYHACILDDAGKVRCWGDNVHGQLGNGVSGDTARFPVEVKMDHLPGVTFTRIEAGGYQTCAEGSDGTIYCWGQNNHGQLGDGTTDSRNVPTAVKVDHLSGVTLSRVAVSGFFTCASGSDGRIYCWGRNDWGQLGAGFKVNTSSTDYRALPVPVAATRGALD